MWKSNTNLAILFEELCCGGEVGDSVFTVWTPWKRTSRWAVITTISIIIIHLHRKKELHVLNGGLYRNTTQNTCKYILPVTNKVTFILRETVDLFIGIINATSPTLYSNSTPYTVCQYLQTALLFSVGGGRMINCPQSWPGGGSLSNSSCSALIKEWWLFVLGDCLLFWQLFFSVSAEMWRFLRPAHLL